MPSTAASTGRERSSAGASDMMSRSSGPLRDRDEETGVVDGAGERAEVLDRVELGRQEVERDPAEARLEADEAAPGGGNPNRAAHVRPLREGHAARRHRRARAAGRAARRPLGFQGFRVTPQSGLSVKLEYANSGVVVFPTMIAPAPRSRSTRRALSSGTQCSNAYEPIVVRLPFVGVRSLIAIGTPWSGPRAAPVMSARSAFRASSIASSG